jgi:hypothetical protein
MTRKDVKGVIESLAEIGYKELKKTGAFFVPGFAKFVVVKKPATRRGKACKISIPSLTCAGVRCSAHRY